MTTSANPLFPILIFADGASSGNPGPGGWGVVIVTPDGQVTELGGGARDTTNNRMELVATISALAFLARAPGEIDLHTDSRYVIQGITQWIWGWRKNGWKTAEGKDVVNADLWDELFKVVARRGKEGKVTWKHVRGHSGVPGNDRVDEIAVAFSKGRKISLYRGPLLQYGIAIHDIPETGELPKKEPSQKREKVVAHSYLSVLGNTPQRHKTWAECEARVKGQSGAKFKKALSADDESAILKSWGYKPTDIKN